MNRKPLSPSRFGTKMIPVLSTVWVALFVLSSAPRVFSQDIKVTSADPASAPQGTVNLNVTIRGSGFKQGAKANFFVTGTKDPGGIGVNQTTFVSSTELVANIDVADTALISTFDIEVLSNGRRGKGTELFAVTEKGNSLASLIPVEAVLRDLASDKIRSDGLGLTAGSSSPSSYNDSEICVIGWADNTNGRFFMRIEGGGDCDLKIIDRSFVLDFTDALERTGNCQAGQSCCQVDDAWGQVGTLDICGVNVVTDVRIIADKLFQNQAPLTTPVVLPFSLSPDFRHTGFELSFEQSVPASGDISTTRTVTAGPQAIAELYRYEPKGGRKVSLGRFRMPFEIVVTLQ
jgi:hypothetical protein